MRYTRVPNVPRDEPGSRFISALQGVAVDRRDRLYAVGDGEVKVFDRDGRLERRWPTARPGCSVAVDDGDRVYVGEAGQLEIFDASGRLADTWRHASRLGRVTAIGFVAGDVLVGDATDRAIRRYDQHGSFINDIGKNNRMQGFLIPNGVVEFAVDRAGVIHATNPGKHRIERYTPDDRLLGHIGRFDGVDPAGFPGCCNPTNVAVDDRGRIYVTEKAEPRVKVYDEGGHLVAIVASEGFDPNCKNMDIAVDSRGRVYVTDPVRLDVLAFEETGGAAS
jgi:sugar lactone lactonase YvrE